MRLKLKLWIVPVDVPGGMFHLSYWKCFVQLDGSALCSYPVIS